MTTIIEVLDAFYTPPLITVLDDSPWFAPSNPNARFRRLKLRVNSPMYPGHEAQSRLGDTAIVHAYEEDGSLWAAPSPGQDTPHFLGKLLDLIKLNIEDPKPGFETVWATFNDTHHILGPIPDHIDLVSTPIEVQVTAGSAFRTLTPSKPPSTAKR